MVPISEPLCPYSDLQSPRTRSPSPVAAVLGQATGPELVPILPPSCMVGVVALHEEQHVGKALRTTAVPLLLSLTLRP